MVARHRVSRAADHREGARRLRRVLVVAERHVTHASHPAHLRRAGWERARQVLAQDDGVRHREGARRRRLAGARRPRSMPARLRGAEAVDDGRVRHALEQRLLQVRRQDRAARDDHEEPREVVRPSIETVEQRARERVADEHEEVHPLALDRPPEVVRVEPLRTPLQHHGASLVERAERRPLRRAVHERRGRHAAQVRAGGRVRDQLGDRRGRRHAGRLAAHGGEVDVLLPPEDALRGARRAAGVEDVEVVGRAGDRRAGR